MSDVMSDEIRENLLSSQVAQSDARQEAGAHHSPLVTHH
jgi:hypothetical protein